MIKHLSYANKLSNDKTAWPKCDKIVCKQIIPHVTTLYRKKK